MAIHKIEGRLKVEGCYSKLQDHCSIKCINFDPDHVTLFLQTPVSEQTEVVTGPEDLIDPEEVKENDAPELSADKKTDEVIGVWFKKEYLLV